MQASLGCAPTRCRPPVAPGHPAPRGVPAPRCPPPRAGAPNFQEPTPEGDGNPALQDALVSMINLEIGKKNVEEYVEESGELLRQKAEEAKEEMDRLAELARLRGEVAFDSALADINRQADEFEEELRRAKEEAAAHDAEFSAWEADVAASRSEGQFFKNLYQAEGKRPAGEAAEGARERAARVTEPAAAEVGSPLRFYLFMALAFLLVADVGADMASVEPSAGPDVLYTALAALAVWLAINERRELPPRR